MSKRNEYCYLQEQVDMDKQIDKQIVWAGVDEDGRCLRFATGISSCE